MQASTRLGGHRTVSQVSRTVPCAFSAVASDCDRERQFFHVESDVQKVG
jgi:hypothetical protein